MFWLKTNNIHYCLAFVTDTGHDIYYLWHYGSETWKVMIFIIYDIMEVRHEIAVTRLSSKLRQGLYSRMKFLTLPNINIETLWSF
jgi:hypothetical protein